MKIDYKNKKPSAIINSKLIREIVRQYYSAQTEAMDFGCGNGHFMYLLKKYGVTCYGVDKEKYHTLKTDFNPDRPHDPLYTHYNQDLNLPMSFESGLLDIATAWNVIEHLENPYLFIREVRRLLRPGGFFILSIPNIFNLKNRLSFLFKGDMYRYNVGNDHKLIFTGHTLKEYIRGFVIKKMGYYTGESKLNRFRTHQLTAETLYLILQKDETTTI